MTPTVDEDILIAEITTGTLFKSAPIVFRTGDGTTIDIADVEARCEFRKSPTGELLTGAGGAATFATSGGGAADGTIEKVQVSPISFSLKLRLESTVTQTLEPAYAGGAIEFAGVGDIEVWITDDSDPDHDEHQPGGRIHVLIFPGVTQ